MKQINIGVDMAEIGAKDRSVIAMAKKGRNGRVYVYYDELSEWPNYKWYRNPIKWYRWRQMMRVLNRKVGEASRQTDNKNNEPS